MGVVNTKRVPREDKTPHLNWMAGRSWDLKDPVFRLRIVASSCFFGEPMYYHKDTGTKVRESFHRGPALSDSDLTNLRETLGALDPKEWRSLGPKDLMEKAIDAALDADPERTLQEAARLRNEERMRTTPQVIMVRAAHHPKVRGTDLIRRYGPQIIRRSDEPAVQLAYQISAYGRGPKADKRKAIPNALKKAWKAALESMSRYSLSKYKTESREVKLVDVVKLSHAHSADIDDLIHGKLKLEDETWEAIVSKGGSNLETWTKAIDVMGQFALLRNLRNFFQKGVNPDFYLPKLVEGAKEDKNLFPFRYFSAYRELKAVSVPGKILDGVEEALMMSMENLPSFPGRVMSLTDNSGSAWGTATSSMGTMAVADIGNLTGILTAMRSDEGYVAVFGDRLQTFPIRAKSSIFDQLEKVGEAGKAIGGGTENGIWLFWDKAILDKEHWDTVFVYSDMQAGHGGLYGLDAGAYRDYRWGVQHIDVAKLIRTYRAKVNPKVNVFLVQIAGYGDTIVPEWYDRTYILGGWGDGILRFAAEMLKISERPKQ